MTQPDLKLRADVAVEVMGWRWWRPIDDSGLDRLFRSGFNPNEGMPGKWKRIEAPRELMCDRTGLPQWELSLDACREVRAEIERREIGDLFMCHLFPLKITPPLWGDTARQWCEAALAAVREAKETDDE